VLGFIFGGTSFAVGDAVNGQPFIVFEVNGWHNIVHIATGVFLVAIAAAPTTAITGAIVFGALYVVVTIWGFIAGDNVLGLVSINLPDNLLHLALAILGLAIGLSARGMTGGAPARGRRRRRPGLSRRRCLPGAGTASALGARVTFACTAAERHCSSN